MFLLSRKKLSGEKAFTLIELMITCLIIGILISITIPSFMTFHLRAEEQKAVATLYAYSQAQKAYWFDHTGITTGINADPNTYCNVISELTPYYVNMPIDDGDWSYSTSGDATTFTVTADHLDLSLSLVLHENGQLDRLGGWPY